MMPEHTYLSPHAYSFWVDGLNMPPASMVFFFWQDLMHACIHAPTPKMHLNLLAVLGELHSQKKVGRGERFQKGAGEGGREK